MMSILSTLLSVPSDTRVSVRKQARQALPSVHGACTACAHTILCVKCPAEISTRWHHATPCYSKGEATTRIDPPRLLRSGCLRWKSLQQVRRASCLRTNQGCFWHTFFGLLHVHMLRGLRGCRWRCQHCVHRPAFAVCSPCVPCTPTCQASPAQSSCIRRTHRPGMHGGQGSTGRQLRRQFQRCAFCGLFCFDMLRG